MHTQEFNDVWQTARRVSLLLWGFFTFSIPIYVAVLYLKPQSSNSIAPQDEATLRILCASLAIFSALASLAMRSLFLSDRRLSRELAKKVDLAEMARNPKTGQVSEIHLKKLQAMSPDECRISKLSTLHVMPFVFSLILAEMVMIWGFVLAFSLARPQSVLPYAFGSLTLQFILFPRMDRLAERGRRILREQMMDGSPARSGS